MTYKDQKFTLYEYELNRAEVESYAYDFLF